MRRPLTALFTAFALMLAACSRPTPPGPSSEPSAAVVAPAASGPSPLASAAASASSGQAGPADAMTGKPAPDFAGTTYDGKVVTLSSFRGKPVVVYFYPKDETPGCTKEACSFRDAWQDLAATGAVLIGVSMDNAESHKEFVEHWKLPFVLLSDADGAIAAKYGVPLKTHGATSFEARQTFVIGPDGIIKKVYREVDVSKHASEVLADLKP
jgi:peroxiredoxin Q/BCP